MFTKIMRSASILMFLLALFLTPIEYARADAVIDTLGRQDTTTGNYAIEVTTDGSTQSVNFNADTAIKSPYQAGTTNDTLTAADSGKTIITKSGTVSGVIFYLPDATVGVNFTFVAGTTHSIYLNPDASDTINYASLAVNDQLYNSSGAKGDSVTLFCGVADQWEVIVHSGTWVDGQVGG